MEVCERGHEQSPENIVQFASRSYSQCRLCHREDGRKSRKALKQKFPERWKVYLRRRNLAKRFNISLEQYEALLAKQNYCCAGCGKHQDVVGTLSVDHDHRCCPDRNKTCGNCIRGLLCKICNFAVGCAKNDIAVLRNLANYIEAYDAARKCENQSAAIGVFQKTGARF